MKQTALVFPHQLFRQHPAIRGCDNAVMIEDPLYFGDKKYPLNFHKKKLLLHRASMKAYESCLKSKGIRVKYYDHADFDGQDAEDIVFEGLARDGTEKVCYADTFDFILEKRIKRASRKHGIALCKTDSPSFITPPEIFENVFGRKNKYLMSSFYIAQRRRLNLLIGKDGGPLGGKWSYDAENRKRLPRNHSVPSVHAAHDAKVLSAHSGYVNSNFHSNPGSTDDFIFPVEHDSAEKWLEDFLGKRLNSFGEYEDSISSDNAYLYHSLLSPLLNTGLLTPDLVVDRLLEFSGRHDVPLNSTEGFLRQIIGWREFIMLIYLKDGVKQRNSNFWNFDRKMPDSFYNGTTGIVPFDTVVRRVLKTSYCHHIERLMILGNFMFLCGIHPHEVYRWFMEMFIDSYDWVMVPNIYGMSQFSDGGLMATKPYISSSNYILKMSDYRKGEWCSVWDSLYWRFISDHKEFFSASPRLSMMSVMLEKMDRRKLHAHISTAEKFLGYLK
ncbi:MAG: cryptochrome/photolyase family protein [Ignavibacteria bacterium]|nr:cryptochrome/photolyase family protein [Ignavibacteria bacterium]